MSRIIISGVTGAGAPNRLEIHDFVKNDKFFSLYIQAIQAMYDTGEDQDPSFFQVGGIHGLPYIPWNGATSSDDDLNDRWPGYCFHSSVLFPTWHRPYVALVEQIIQQKAKEIAATYLVDALEWREAADNLRQPYWDWAANMLPPDEVIINERVTITGSNGNRVSVPNPLFQYTFHKIPDFPSPYNVQHTYREPGNSGKPETDIQVLQNHLKANQHPIRTSTYRMLTRTKTWGAFSNTTGGDGDSGANSLEGVHNNIHDIVGGDGFMGDPAVAGFDPIFFMHHCNVDRMISLWAALHPDVWVSPGNSSDGSFTEPPNTAVDKTTSLTPFWNADTTFWASSGLQDTTVLGYTYPEFNGLDMGNADAVRSHIVKIVNELYRWPDIFGQIIGHGLGLPHRQVAAAVPVPPAAGHAQTTNPWDWTARVEFKKYELKGSFSVLLFIGPVPEDPKDWVVAPSFVGMHSAFVNSVAEQCANCQNNADVVEEGFVHLDEAIMAFGQVSSLEPNVVEPYLKKNLNWRVKKSDGTAAELPSLEVKVSATPLSLPINADFPVLGRRQYLHRITHGRPGGSRTI